MNMVNFLDAAILGIVEGLTEFLPVSSTGHLILAGHLLGIPDTAFLKSFEIAIQLGAIGAVLVLYWRSFLEMSVVKRLAVAFLPTGIIGLATYRFIKEFLLGNETVVLASLAVGGIVLIIFELWHRESESAVAHTRDMSYRQAFLIGLFQAIAIVPGVSRSGATIIGGLLTGLQRVAIVEFSFLLAVPTMGAATAFDLLKNYSAFSVADIWVLSIGFITAFLVALLVIRFFLRFVRTQTFVSFGIYRILVALLFFLILM